ncbi:MULTISPECIES: dermonecrotic toxin domain-containing protein [unclassified Pseudomonas]|uniref:dermonecrotic toxin domain-containing protein n=1 Tax=unclassified Pseudomonas TaxID=196821 RepID=UPI002AC8D213|nr:MULTISPECIES: DUF6543 domain-containing protein [unclassified Pseudomonas]MEB0048344.1 hypothetical protein [Pseudomonas sp. Dout3]MEB0099270.1 hypothetical protein [Pseudomonas sp. DC1.2]WPX58867.1 hypothetical protein RHM68_25370 [Pseudomonas sp. DC1.2]
MTQSSDTPTQQKTVRHAPLEALMTQLCVGPDLGEVAAVLLRQALQALYPNLDIDPAIAMVGTSCWEIVDDAIIPKPTQYEALTDILAGRSLNDDQVIYLESQHFLTQQPLTDPVLHLPVRIAEIASTLNILAPQMLIAYQEQQLAFWNKTDNNGVRWHALSSTLRNIWNVDKVEGWTTEDCRMARHFFHAPDLATRGLNNPFGSKAYLFDIDSVDGENVKHLNEMPFAALIGTHQGRTSILMYSGVNGYEKFDSLEQLGASLPVHLDTSRNYKKIQWRLYEPSGHFFDQQACTLISMQIDIIGALSVADLNPIDAVQSPLRKPLGIVELSEKKGPVKEWFRDLLPDWLRNASSSDLTLYSRHLKDLATLHSLNAGQSYQDGILPIDQYTLKALKDEMTKDHADAARLKLDMFTVRIESQLIWGTFTVPGKTEVSLFSLVELALQNLVALPLGNKTLRSTNGNSRPAWLTVDYIEALIKRVNIGSTYPALIKAKLLDDPKEKARREALYTQHLRIQLPLLAMQCRIRNEAGIDERGYRYVVAVMQPDLSDHEVEGQIIVIRPLAFIPKRRITTTADVVANMFVIGPQDPAAGPCLLYRPLLDEPLTQYPSPANLLYAIQQSVSLRNSVLAWLPDAARSDYEFYVFPGQLPSPWAALEFLVDPVKLWTMSGPMSLGAQPLNGELFANLYQANANALIELADRQSVSNTEARWATFKHSGWLIFSSVLPFLNRTAGTATWIWQMVDTLQTFVEDYEQKRTQEEWATFVDILLTLGLAITVHMASRNRPTRSISAKKSQPELLINTPPLAEPTVVKKIPDLTAYELPPGHFRSLHTSGALNRLPASLGSVLDSFKTVKPEGLVTPSTVTGAHRHLYPLGQKWYAPVGERWFEVTVDTDAKVIIVDPRQTTRTGPTLINNAKGEWFIDTRLRLRGGGLPTQKQKNETLITTRAALLRSQLTTFENEKKTTQDALQLSRQQMTDAQGTSVEGKRELYLQKLETQRTDYEDALQKLKTLNVFTPLHDYQQRSLGYLKAQLDLTQAGITEALTTFTPKLRTVLDQAEQQGRARQDRHIEDAGQMSVLNRDMIKRLSYIQSRFTHLKVFAKEGLQLIQDTRKRLPAYAIEDLKALQVTLSRNLCLASETTTTAPDAWYAIDQIIDSADLTIQGLRDTLAERSENRLDERIGTLNSLFEQFSGVDERLQDFKLEFPGQVLEEPFTRLRDQITEFKQSTVNNLVLLIGERNILRVQPGPSQTTPRPKRRFIHTRYNGVLIGEPRLSDAGLETNLVDIKSPLTQKTMATFHEKTPGVWVERVQSSESTAVAPNIQSSTTAGQALLDGLTAFKTRATAQMNQPGRTPTGVEYLYHQHAMRLEQASRAIEQALTDANLTDDNSISAAEISKNLDAAVESLYTQAHIGMEKMIKEQPPTIAGIEWLNGKKLIAIKKTINRRRLKGSKSDYLDEYTVSDSKSHKVFWYAHFHYSMDWPLSNRTPAPR